MSSSANKVAQFLANIASRRSIYGLAKTPAILSDKEIHDLVQNTVKHSPSSFNSQSSRVVILLGAEHDAFWKDLVPKSLRASDREKDSIERNVGRANNSADALGTVLFFETQKTIDELKAKSPAVSSSFLVRPSPARLQPERKWIVTPRTCVSVAHPLVTHSQYAEGFQPWSYQSSVSTRIRVPFPPGHVRPLNTPCFLSHSFLRLGSQGMAQINTWTALSLQGYGANLQHFDGESDVACACDFHFCALDGGAFATAPY